MIRGINYLKEGVVNKAMLCMIGDSHNRKRINSMQLKLSGA
jgi:hypothetical protein